MSKNSRKPKTEGLEWLVHSLMAFNGSGYADMNSADDFIDSYIIYNEMKNRPHAVVLVNIWRREITPEIESLLERTLGAGRTPSEKNLKKFDLQKNQARLF